MTPGLPSLSATISFLISSKKESSEIKGHGNQLCSQWMDAHFASNNSLVYVCTYRIWLIQR